MICDLTPEKNYTLHYGLLQFALEGIVLKNVQRVSSSRQERFLHQFLNKLIELGKEARNDFEKSTWKLLVNSLRGKFLENLFKCINFKLHALVLGK